MHYWVEFHQEFCCRCDFRSMSQYSDLQPMWLPVAREFGCIGTTQYHPSFKWPRRRRKILLSLFLEFLLQHNRKDLNQMNQPQGNKQVHIDQVVCTAIGNRGQYWRMQKKIHTVKKHIIQKLQDKKSWDICTRKPQKSCLAVAAA